MLPARRPTVGAAPMRLGCPGLDPAHAPTALVGAPVARPDAAEGDVTGAEGVPLPLDLAVHDDVELLEGMVVAEVPGRRVGEIGDHRDGRGLPPGRTRSLQDTGDVLARAASGHRLRGAHVEPTRLVAAGTGFARRFGTPRPGRTGRRPPSCRQVSRYKCAARFTWSRAIESPMARAAHPRPSRTSGVTLLALFGPGPAAGNGPSATVIACSTTPRQRTRATFRATPAATSRLHRGGTMPPAHAS